MNDVDTSSINMTLVIGLAVCAFAGTVTLFLGFFLSALGKYKVAYKLMKCGRVCVLLMIVIFASISIRLGYYWQGIALLASIGFGLMIKSKINVCPCCSEFVEFERQWFYFIKWGFFRKKACCSSCGVELIRSKWPWRMMQSGFFLMLTCIFLRFMKVAPNVALSLMFWASLSFFGLGTLTFRFEVVNTNGG